MARTPAARTEDWRLGNAKKGRKEIRITTGSDLEPLLRAVVSRVDQERVPDRRARLIAELQAGVSAYVLQAPAGDARGQTDGAPRADPVGVAPVPAATAADPAGATVAAASPPGAGGSARELARPRRRPEPGAAATTGGEDGAGAPSPARPGATRPSSALLDRARELARARRVALPEAAELDRDICAAFVREHG